MVRRTVKYALLAGGLALSSVATAGGMASGAMLGNTCAGCHGTNGHSAGPAAPSIAGMNDEYFVERMKEYREGTQHSTIMGRIAKGYTDEEFVALAKHFAAQPYEMVTQTFDAEKAKAGAKLHKKSCEKCHEENGLKGEEAGKLAGQWMPYLHYTMEDFRSGASEMPKKMAKKVEKLSDEDVEALLHFYASQK
ncbi:c-type cytochrome [Endothiovibrio diazotrophicus]